MKGNATTGSRTTLARAARVLWAIVSDEWPRAVRGDARAIHRIRTASRRLRELLRVIDMVASDAGADRARRDARRLARALRVVRDLDVVLSLVDEKRETKAWSASDVRRLEEALRSSRAAALREVKTKLAALDKRRWQARGTALVRLLEEDEPSGHWKNVLADRLRARGERVLASIDAAGTLYAPERLHSVRLAVKKLRYCVELTRDLGGMPAASALSALKRIQNRLGRLHDLHALDRHVRDLPMWDTRENGRDLSGIAAAIARECRQEHAAFLAERAPLAALSRRAVREGALALIGRVPSLRMALPMSSVPTTAGRTSRATRRAT